MAPSTLIFGFDCSKSRTFPLNALFTKIVTTKVIRNKKRIINFLFLITNIDKTPGFYQM